jgi:hypothetical protein
VARTIPYFEAPTPDRTQISSLHLEARYVELLVGCDDVERVVAVWCELNGRFRRFTADNVRELRKAKHVFYMRDAAGATHDITVVGLGEAAHLSTMKSDGERDVLCDLLDWGREGRSAGHSSRPPRHTR